MGTTYYVNRTIPLFGTYTCSKCKSVLVLQFQLKCGGASTWSQKKATEAMDEHAQKLLAALSNFQEKPFLITTSEENRSSWTTGYSWEFENGEHHCPFCNNHEIWQRSYSYAAACRKDPVTGVSLVPECPQESRMMVFPSVEAASAEMKRRLLLQKYELEKQWAGNPGEADRVKSQLAFLKLKLEGLEPRKATAKDRSNALSAQIAAKEAEMKKMSLFSAEKKAAKAELKELNARYTAQRDADIQEERRLTGEIESIYKQMKDLKIENPGVLNEIEQVEGKGKLAHIGGRIS